MEISFLKLLEEELLREKADKAVKYKDYAYRHNPSSASSKLPDGSVIGACLRQLYYRATKQPETDKDDLTGMLQMGFGEAIHTWILDRLSKSDKLRLTKEFAGKVMVDNLTRELSFRVDGIADWEGVPGGLEIKTSQDYALTYMQKEGQGPKLDHAAQVISYFGAKPDMKWFNLAYFGRGAAYRLEYQLRKLTDGSFTVRGVLPILPETPLKISWKSVSSRWKELENYLDNKQLPPRDYKVVYNKDGQIVDKRVKNGIEYKSDFRCMYCGYLKECWKGEDAKREAKFF